MKYQEAVVKLAEEFGPDTVFAGPHGEVVISDDAIFCGRLVRALLALGLLESDDE